MFYLCGFNKNTMEKDYKSSDEMINFFKTEIDSIEHSLEKCYSNNFPQYIIDKVIMKQLVYNICFLEYINNNLKEYIFGELEHIKEVLDTLNVNELHADYNPQVSALLEFQKSHLKDILRKFIVLKY